MLPSERRGGGDENAAALLHGAAGERQTEGVVESRAFEVRRQSTPKTRADQSRTERVGENFAREQELLLFGLKSLCGLKIPLH